MGLINLRISRNRTALLFYSTFFLFFLIGSAISFHYLFSNYTSTDPEFSRWEKAITIAVSVTGFLSLLISIKTWQDSDSRQINQATISLFEKFRDDRFAEIRKKAWEVRNRWYLEEGYMEKIIESSKNIAEEYNDNLLMKDMRVVRNLIEFYTVLCEYQGCEDIIKRCRYFHHGFWRPFLYEIAQLHDNYNTPLSSFREDYPMQYEEYKEGISYVATLKRMDKLLDLDVISDLKYKFHDFN